MKNAALSGKPYAGNPHVRFDEGEVASGKPRRGSLLYKNEKKMLSLLAGIVMTALGAAQAGNERVVAHSYVQSGIIAHWDGIDNANTGTHNASATTWTDRVAGRKFELHNTAWNSGNKLSFNGSSSYAFLSGTDTSKTFTIVASKGTMEIPAWFSSSTWKTMLKSTANVSVNIQPSAYYMSFRNSTTHTHNVGVNATYTLAVTYRSGTAGDFSVYRDAKEVGQTGRTDNVGGNANGGTYLGARSTSSSTFSGERFFYGDFKAIRLYNRVLTAEELQINNAIDKVRFFGNTADILTLLPTGWDVLTNGYLCRRYFGECKIPNETNVSDYPVLFDTGTDVTISTDVNQNAPIFTCAKDIYVRQDVSFTFPSNLVSGTYTLLRGTAVHLDPGVELELIDPKHFYRCTPIVAETEVRVKIEPLNNGCTIFFR